MTSTTITALKTLNDLGNIQDGDYIVGNRGANNSGTISFGGVIYDTDFGTNGLMARVSAGVYSNRTLTGVLNRTTVTNGDGVSGNPTVDISASYAGQSTITTLGTITTGVWTGTDIAVADGGTGRDTATAYAPVFGGTTATGAHQSGTAGTSGQLLQSGGASAVGGWTTATYPTTASTSGKRLKSDGTNLIMSTTTMPDTGTSGTIIRGNGTNYVESTSTFADTYTASNLLYSNGANTVTGLATANSGVLVTSAGGVPSIATDIPTAVTIGGAYSYRVGGTDVAVADGGTNLSSYAQGDLLYASGTTTIAVLAKDTNATRYLSNQGTSNNPSWNQVNLANGVTGTLTVTNGGTGVATMTTAYAPVCAGTTATGALQVASTGLSTVDLPMVSNGASAIPSFKILPVAGGGTGIASRPSFRAYLNTSAQALTTATFTKILFNAEEWDIGSYFDSTTNYRYTPLVAGTYIFSASLFFNSIADQKLVIVALYKNGTSYARFSSANASGTDLFNVGNIAIVQMNGTTDYVEIFGYHEHGSNRNIDNGQTITYFSGMWIGP